MIVVEVTRDVIYERLFIVLSDNASSCSILLLLLSSSIVGFENLIYNSALYWMSINSVFSEDHIIQRCRKLYSPIVPKYLGSPYFFVV